MLPYLPYSAKHNPFTLLTRLTHINRLNLLPPLNPLIKSSKGISIITIIIIAAIVVAALNAYAYFNPDFQLSRYSIVYLIRVYNDNQRKADLNKIQEAVERYYNENGSYPASDSWCGRIFSIMHPEVKDAISDYFKEAGVPQDPSFRGSNKDYFYRREDRDTYILMAVLENLPANSPTYSYGGCFDWPGGGVYNYRIIGSR